MTAFCPAFNVFATVGTESQHQYEFLSQMGSSNYNKERSLKSNLILVNVNIAALEQIFNTL